MKTYINHSDYSITTNLIGRLVDFKVLSFELWFFAFHFNFLV